MLGPYLTKVAVDKYLAHTSAAHSFLDRWLSSAPLIGIAQIAAVYVGLQLFSFLLEFLQTYYMQWENQQSSQNLYERRITFGLRARF